MRFQVSGFCVSVLSDVVAIGYELRLSTKGFLATVDAVVSFSSLDQSKFLYIYFRFFLILVSSHCPFNLGF